MADRKPIVIEDGCPREIVDGNSLIADSFRVNPDGISNSTQIGTVKWNELADTLVAFLHNSTEYRLGQEIILSVENTSGQIIQKGQLIALAGVDSNSKKIQVSGWVGSGQPLGICRDTIPANSAGYVLVYGEIRGIQTSGSAYSEIWVAGDLLYPSDTGLTNQFPTVAERRVKIATVLLPHNSDGVLLIQIEKGKSDQIFVENPTSGDILIYSAVSDQFENSQPNIAGHSISVETLTSGDLLEFDGTVWKNRSNAPAIDTSSITITGGTINGITIDGGSY